jgi:hypothetical protein
LDAGKDVCHNTSTLRAGRGVGNAVQVKVLYCSAELAVDAYAREEEPPGITILPAPIAALPANTAADLRKFLRLSCFMLVASPRFEGIFFLSWLQIILFKL